MVRVLRVIGIDRSDLGGKNKPRKRAETEAGFDSGGRGLYKMIIG